MTGPIQDEQPPTLLGEPLSIRCTKCLQVFDVMASSVLIHCPVCGTEHYLDPAGRVWGPEALTHWREKVAVKQGVS